jgi:hypothetical protein
LIHKRAGAFVAPVARKTCYPNSQLFRVSSLAVRSQRQRVFSTPGLRRSLVVREVAIREAQSRDRATEAIVIGALKIEARLHHGAGQIRADPVAANSRYPRHPENEKQQDCPLDTDASRDQLMSKGVVYIATGQKFIDEACNSAASLKSVMPNMPSTIFCDEQSVSAHFENVIPINAARFGFIDKIINMSSSPYDYTLFLDTDTYVCEDLTDLFAVLEMFDIAVAHAPYRAVYQVAGVPDSFPEFNAGVVLFKKSPKIMTMFSEWRNLYERDSKKELQWLHPLGKTMFKGYINDQPTFREALYLSNLRIATLTSEYNCRFNFPGFVHHKVKILHGRHKDLQTIERAINAQVGPRAYIMSFGTLRVFSHPQPSEQMISQIRSSLQIRGFWQTVAVAKQRLFDR